MSLKKILTDLSTELGLNPSNDEERAWLIDKVNDAAKRLYDSQDIPGCLREQTFNIDDDAVTTSLISLPYYIDQIRGLRFSQVVGGSIPLNDMRPRYHNGKGWGANAFNLPYRITREEVPLMRDIANAGRLTLTLADVEPTDTVVIIVGQTETSDRLQEVVTIAAGCLSVDTQANFIDIVAIEKQDFTKHNIEVKDVEGNVLSIIPNSELTTSYKWLQLQDTNAGQLNVSSQYLSGIDILYKTKFVPFRNLYDEFPCGPKCDRAIFFQFVAYWEGQKPDNELRVLGAIKEAQTILANLNTNTEEARSLDIQFGDNGLLEAQRPFKYPDYPYVRSI